jgi:hypothetical protein
VKLPEHTTKSAMYSKKQCKVQPIPITVVAFEAIFDISDILDVSDGNKNRNLCKKRFWDLIFLKNK